MGLRGPAPKPSAIEQAEGNPGKRAKNTREPKPCLVRPKMPSHLDKLARKEWKRLCPILERMRVLTEADGGALAGLCFDASLLQQAQEALGKTGLLTKTAKSGVIHLSPLLHLVAVTADRLARGFQQFGLTPASRSRVQTVEEKKDDFLELLSAPRVTQVRPN
jgi:P27 family predicted phage terminase small subunit